jgi:hypothetical protein
MEYSEPVEHAHGQELAAVLPGELFAYAKNREQQLRAKLAHQLTGAVEILAINLEDYVMQHFEGMPDVIGESQDVYYTKGIERRASGNIVIDQGPLPLHGEGEIAAFEQHPIQGKLYGFHRGTHNELRAYVSNGDEPQRFMGGVYTPLLSVGVERSSLQFVEYSLEEKTDYIDDHLKTMDQRIVDTTNELLLILPNSKMTMVKKLHDISPLFKEIVSSKNVTPQFVDALIEVVKYKLRLDLPHDLSTDFHRVVISGPPTNAHKRITEKTSFTRVTPEIGIAGESMSPWLGVFFIQDNIDEKGPVNIQIPVEYITSIYKTEQ